MTINSIRQNIINREKILKLIDFRLSSIKHIHTKFFGNLDVIIMGDFNQV